MPCFFCIAVLTIIAGSAIAAAVDKIEEKLSKKASGPVERVSDTESVSKWEFKVKVGRKEVPVAVTLYKDHSRVRIQVLTHELTREETERLQDELADELEAEIVSRSDPEDEQKVKDAVEAEKVTEKEKASERPRERTKRIPK